MGISERREREKNERRRAILDSARELILKQGVEKVSMEDIASKVELSKATLYLYFPGKETIFNEICEEAARFFLEHSRSVLESGLTGINAMKKLWQGYMELFGSSNEMVIIFKVRNFLYPGQPFVSMEEYGKSSNIDAVIDILKIIIEQCKEEGVFDPELDSSLATSLLLSLFSNSIDNAARISYQARKSPVIINNLIKSYQIIIRGFAKEGIDRSSLDITIN